MSDITVILSAIEQGDPRAAEQLLAIVYDELRQLAAQKLAHEKPGQTLDPTSLVHEAYLRLFGGTQPHWQDRRHFFGSAAEAMRRILIERARRKKRQRHGGDRRQVEMPVQEMADDQAPPEDLLALDEALTKLGLEDPSAAHLVKLRFFTGLSVEQAGDVLGVSRATAYQHWNYARAWLRCEILGSVHSKENSETSSIP
jgi:RNA polymerase sigma factor (TIGR02999 family)